MLANIHKLLQRHPLRVIIILCVAIILFNITPGKIIFGLDNTSPYFGWNLLISRVQNDNNFFVNGPLLFSPTIILGNFLNLPAWIIAHLHIWLSFLIGIVGQVFLLDFFLKKTKTRVSPELLLIFVFLILGHLSTIWIFSQIVFSYVNAFASIPWIILLLTDGFPKEKKVLSYLFIFISVLLFFSISSNIVAFTLYFGAVVLLSLALTQKEEWKKIMVSAVVLGLTYLSTSQALMILTNHPRFVISEAINHLNAITNHPYTAVITADLAKAEGLTGNFLNIARFATGWLLLNSAEGKVTPFSDAFLSNPIMIIIQIIPLVFIPLAASRAKKLPKEVMALAAIWIVTILLSSNFFRGLLVHIPVMGSSLRFLSSKVYPLLSIPFFFLFTYFLNEWKESSTNEHRFPFIKKVFYFIIVLSVAIPAVFLWSTHNVVSKYAANALPSEYLQFDKSIIKKKIIYFPQPTRLYFRSYHWGYYGSDFISYLSTNEIIDGGSLSQRSIEYSRIAELLKNCTLSDFDFSNTVIVFDQSATNQESDLEILKCLESEEFTQTTNGRLLYFTKTTSR